MTCIAIARTKTGLMMAGDRKWSYDMSRSFSGPHPKIKKVNNILLGITGSGDVCQLILDHFSPREPMNELEVIADLRKLLIDNHYSDSEGKLVIPEKSDSLVLLGYKDVALTIDLTAGESISTISYGKVPLPHAEGCGGKYATAVLMDRMKSGINTKQDIMRALEITSMLSPGCDNHIDFIKT